MCHEKLDALSVIVTGSGEQSEIINANEKVEALSTEPVTMPYQEFAFDGSVKDVPNPTNKDYMLYLVQRTEEFIVWLRWACLDFLKPESFPKTVNKTYGLKTRRFPQKVSHPALKGFEEDIWSLVKNIEYTNDNTNYQKHLKTEISRIKRDENIIVKADKGTNLYKMSKEEYIRTGQTLISKSYKNVTEESKSARLDKPQRK